MKQYDKIKTVQLFVYLAITLTGLYIIFTDEELYRTIGSNSYFALFFVLLWVIVLISFIFMILDFRAIRYLKLNVNELDHLIFSDPVSGIANRYSCDAILEKYMDKPLPADVGCVTFAITSLREINAQYSHHAGNQALKGFSRILAEEAGEDCFVGRNGGDKFLAVLTSCSDKKIEEYTKKIQKCVDEYNETATEGELKIQFGAAFNEGEEIKDISSLIALSNRRAIEKYRTFVER